MNKAIISKLSAELYGAKPYFYKEEDVSAFCRVLTANALLKDPEYKLEFAQDCLYTYHPTIDAVPLDNQTGFRACDKFGFFRLGLLHNLIRPHFNNVRSCHRLEAELKAPAGNLSYIANPWWATYAFYQTKESNVQLLTNVRGLEPSDYDKLPNIVATVNVLFGVNSLGKGSALISRVYGVANLEKKSVSDATYSACLYRLVEYLQSLQLKVYFHHKWLGTFHSIKGKRIKTNEIAEYITSYPVVPTIRVTNPQNKSTKGIVYRYPDIERPLTTLYENVSDNVKAYLETYLPEVRQSNMALISEKLIGYEAEEFDNKNKGRPTLYVTGNIHQFVSDPSKLINYPGFIPMGHTQILMCRKCGVDSEKSSVSVRDCGPHGMLCSNCSLHLLLNSYVQGVPILRDSAISYIMNVDGSIDYISPEFLATRPHEYVKLSWPTNTGATMAHSSTVYREETLEVIVNTGGECIVKPVVMVRGSKDFVQLTDSAVQDLGKYLNTDLKNRMIFIHVNSYPDVREFFKHLGYLSMVMDVNTGRDRYLTSASFDVEVENDMVTYRCATNLGDTISIVQVHTNVEAHILSPYALNEIYYQAHRYWGSNIYTTMEGVIYFAGSEADLFWGELLKIIVDSQALQLTSVDVLSTLGVPTVRPEPDGLAEYVEEAVEPVPIEPVVKPKRKSRKTPVPVN